MLIWNKIWNKVHTINCYPKNIFRSKTFHNRSIDYHNEQNISNFNVATNRIVDLSFRNLVAFLNTASGSLVPSIIRKIRCASTGKWKSIISINYSITGMSISVRKREINDHEGNVKLCRTALKVIIHHYLTWRREKFKILEKYTKLCNDNHAML